MTRSLYKLAFVLALSAAFAFAQEPATSGTSQTSTTPQAGQSTSSDRDQNTTTDRDHDRDHDRAQNRHRKHAAGASDEDTIRRQVKEQLATNPDFTNIQVSVSNAVVTLTGTVPNKDDRKQAMNLVQAVPGVTRVKNNLTINASASTSSSTTTTGGISGATGTTANQTTTPSTSGSIAGNTEAQTGVTSGSAATGTTSSGSATTSTTNANTPFGNIPQTQQSNTCTCPNAASSGGVAGATPNQTGTGTVGTANSNAGTNPPSASGQVNTPFGNVKTQSCTCPNNNTSSSSMPQSDVNAQSSTSTQSSTTQPSTGAQSSTTQGTLGTSSNSTQIQQVQQALQQQQIVNVQVVNGTNMANNNVIQLVGTVNNEQDKDRAEQVAKQALPGVTIENNIKVTSSASSSSSVSQPPAGSATGEAGEASSQQNVPGSTLPQSDVSAGQSTSTTGNTTATSTSGTDLQQQIENAIKSDTTLADSNVMVNVTDTQIELTGTVPTGKERQTAKRIAQSYANNRRVVDRLTVTGKGHAKHATGGATGSMGSIGSNTSTDTNTNTTTGTTGTSTGSSTTQPPTGSTSGTTGQSSNPPSSSGSKPPLL